MQLFQAPRYSSPVSLNRTRKVYKLFESECVERDKGLIFSVSRLIFFAYKQILIG